MKSKKIKLFFLCRSLGIGLLLSLVIAKAFAVSNKTFFLPNTKGQELIINQTQSDRFARKNKLKEFESVNADRVIYESKLLSVLPSVYKDINIEKKIDKFFISNSWFYEESCSAGGLAQYFMPNGKTELIVKGQGVAGPRDIYAEWLGIAAFGADVSDVDSYTFNSRFSISPEIKRWGTNLFVYKKLHKHFWLSVLVPFANVATNARLNEFGITGERPEGLLPEHGSLYYEEPLNVTQALSHPLMKYGKIDNIKHQKAGIADINLRLGINKKYKDKYLWDFYAQGVIPTADKPTAEYLFEPIVGNGHHFGVGCGLKFSTEFKNFTFLTSFDYLYLFQGTEKRSFDLHNGPWSRYMAATLGLPRNKPERLINYLTQDLQITPGSQFNALFSIDYNKDKFHFEFGTNIECKSDESVSLKDGWSESVAIAFYDDLGSFDLVADGNYNLSYPTAKIDSTMYVDDPGLGFVTIKEDDLNLNSARVLNSLSINPYLNIGFDGKFANNFFNVGLGIFYKANSNNKSIGSLGIWLNFNLEV